MRGSPAHRIRYRRLTGLYGASGDVAAGKVDASAADAVEVSVGT